MDDKPRTTRPTRIKDITGNRYGMLLVTGINPERSAKGRVLFDCLCDCGQTKTIMANSLKRGLSQSCGCQVLIAAHKPKPQMRTHGFGHTWIHGVWYKMVERCYDPESVSFPRYGGRGIRVCDRWKNSITDFYADMGDRPTPDHSLDRIDNDGDYCPENCRWATAKEQANNRRSSRMLEYQGESLSVAEWSERLGMPYSTLVYRLKRGWSIERTLTEPKQTEWDRRPERFRMNSSDTINTNEGEI